MAAEPFVPAPPTTLAREGCAETLDWIAFCARFFPGLRERHDLEALVAYEEYRRDRRRDLTSEEEMLIVSVVEEERARATDDRILAPSADLSSWESEGGTTLS